jgi:hypothetical protein
MRDFVIYAGYTVSLRCKIREHTAQMRDKNTYHFDGESSLKCVTWKALKGREW